MKKHNITEFNLNKYFTIKKILWFLFYITLIGAIFTTALFTYFIKDLPQPEYFNEIQQSKATEIYDVTGETLLYRIGTNKTTTIKIDDISDYLKKAVIATEDAKFYTHNGIDPTGIIRALKVNLTRSRSASVGGSTITQQLIRTTFLTQEKTIPRKVKEIILSLQLEQRYSKDQILEWYLNRYPFCYNMYGVEQISQFYFNKSAKDLDLGESSMIAALIQKPCGYDPFGENREGLMQRRDLYTLQRMLEEGFITQEEYDNTIGIEPEFNQDASIIVSPHFSLYVKSQLLKEFGEDYLIENGLKIYTTLNWDLQQEAEKIVKEQSEINKAFNAHNGALIAINPKNGHILAMVGSKDYFGKTEPEECEANCLFDSKVNITTYGRGRQPGSAFKPFAYVTAFKKGYDDDTIVVDELTDFGVWGTDTYEPHNYDGTFKGPVTLRNALAQSLNIPAVKTLLYLAGLDETIKTAKDCGITTLTAPFGPSIVLGGWEVRPIEITAAYGVFANNGYKVKTTPISKIEDYDGNLIKEYKSNPKKVIDSKSCKILNHILSDNSARAPMFGFYNNLYIPGYEVAAKTGTSNDARDAWTIGYTPNISIGVWVGNNNNKPTKQIGSTMAGPIFKRFMTYYLMKNPLDQNFKY